MVDLAYTESQRPIVAQIWGRDPQKFYDAAKLIQSLGFNGVDINMGCPQDKEIEQKTCAYLIREPKLAQEIVLATKEGAGNLPVSVKTRIGYSQPETESWISTLLDTRPAVITVHGRTKKEKSKVPAHWDEITKAVEIRNKHASFQTLILGNGDITSREQALARIAETGVDGVMVARGAFGNPWLFNAQIANGLKPFPTVEERLMVMLEHAELYEQKLNGQKPFIHMRKNFKAYCSGFAGAAELRAKLMEVENTSQAREIVKGYLKQLSV
jgi:tRNA-dihydrouridine synthase